jgi:16S rRNA (adenine1518-N6/adenine1519-N6)-dimethyltransferase
LVRRPIGYHRFVRTKPKLGQNFLIDQQAIRRIVAAAGDCAGRTVIEIGPGEGAITRELSAIAGQVLALEVDRELARRLSAEFPRESGNVEVQRADVLEFDFAAVPAPQRLIVVGNLPYYITSPILLKLAENSDVLDRAVLMVQREVADRVTAEPGSSDFGILSATVQLHGAVEKLFSLSPDAFSPPPEVHSTVFRWRFAPRFEALGIERGPFLGFLRQVFALKRKTLANNLRSVGVPATTIAGSLSETGIDPRARAESLPIETLAALWKELKKREATPAGEVASVLPN